MESVYYIFLLFVALVFSFDNRHYKNTILFFVIWLVIYVGLALVVRGNFDADIENTYAPAMSGTSLSLYYLKEPVVWLGQRYLYSYVDSAYAVFIIYDILVGVVLFKALANFRIPKYAYFGILIFFPFILGMQNIYRQWVATILFLYSFSLVWAKEQNLKSYVFFTLSILAHNSAAIFFPLLFIKSHNFFGRLAWVLGLFVSFLGIHFGASTKSSPATGIDLSVAYLVLLFFLLCAIVALDKCIILRPGTSVCKLSLSLFALAAFGALILSSAGSERVSMFCLLILFPILSFVLEESFRQKTPMRITFTMLGFIPMLMFPVSVFITQ